MQVPKEREKTDSSVTDNKCTKECDARAMLLFCYCCFDVLVAVNWEECEIRVSGVGGRKWSSKKLSCPPSPSLLRFALIFASSFRLNPLSQTKNENKTRTVIKLRCKKNLLCDIF